MTGGGRATRGEGALALGRFVVDTDDGATRALGGGDAAGTNGRDDGAGADGAGIDGTSTGGAGIDGTSTGGAGFDGAGIDGAGIDGAGIDGAGIDGAGIDGAGIDGAGIDGAGIDGDGDGSDVVVGTGADRICFAAGRSGVVVSRSVDNAWRASGSVVAGSAT